ncbi:putative inactive receptor kinase [Camellia lanceoleosa]|uniref:Inactive receptor kinase n=1 Tax=Camellia lanceoleosa TaxID=1840588 RepID=A0ACC0HRN8_9ERIC|nr:putative inactive receptor kinase [Camellia lanceoleosa]
MIYQSGSWMFFLFLIMIIVFSIYKPIISIIIQWLRKVRSSDGGKVTNATPVSLLEVKVLLPAKVIFADEAIAVKYDPFELVQLPKTRLGEGTLGTLYRVVLNNGLIVTMRKIQVGLVLGLVGSDDLELWIEFFGGLRCAWLLAMQFSFWYGGEAFIIHEYLCLGSLEELLHGGEGTQFTPLNWGVRIRIALCAAKAVAFIHKQVTKKGLGLVCGVIKSSNVLIQLDFSACLSGYETPYLISPTTIIRRNPGRVAPELTHPQYSPKVFTQKSDVYSFGVLLLEIVTGKKPTVTNLGEYVKQKRKKEGLRGLYDKKMVDLEENVVDELLGIAGICLLHNPNARPSMETVVQMIQRLQQRDSLSSLSNKTMN